MNELNEKNDLQNSDSNGDRSLDPSNNHPEALYKKNINATFSKSEKMRNNYLNNKFYSSNKFNSAATTNSASNTGASKMVLLYFSLIIFFIFFFLISRNDWETYCKQKIF
jgi:hypothetical protein